MKTSVTVCLALIHGVALASDAPQLGFPQATIGLPPLSLNESAMQSLPKPFDNAEPSVRQQSRLRRLGQRKGVSNMPVIQPPSDVHHHLHVQAPDESVDHKMVVKDPDIESAK